jgi:hypothetical protein
VKPQFFGRLNEPSASDSLSVLYGVKGCVDALPSNLSCKSLESLGGIIQASPACADCRKT